MLELTAQRKDFECARLDAAGARCRQISFILDLFEEDAQLGTRGIEQIRTEIVDGRKVTTSIKWKAFSGGAYRNPCLDAKRARARGN